MATVPSPRHSVAASDDAVERLLVAADVPGLAMAVIRGGALERTLCCGVRDARYSASVDEDTVFDAASLSKPVFAHAVVFTNGASGLSLMPEIVASLLPGPRPSLTWLGYGRHDSPARAMLQAARARGAAAAWDAMAVIGSLSADELRWVARGLAAAGLDEDGAWLRRQAEANVPPTPPRAKA